MLDESEMVLRIIVSINARYKIIENNDFAGLFENISIQPAKNFQPVAAEKSRAAGNDQSLAGKYAGSMFDAADNIVDIGVYERFHGVFRSLSGGGRER